MCASDGLWDNVWEEEIISLVTREVATPDDVERAAKALAETAQASPHDLFPSGFARC